MCPYRLRHLEVSKVVMYIVSIFILKLNRANSHQTKISPKPSNSVIKSNQSLKFIIIKINQTSEKQKRTAATLSLRILSKLAASKRLASTLCSVGCVVCVTRLTMMNKTDLFLFAWAMRIKMLQCLIWQCQTHTNLSCHTKCMPHTL